MGLRLGKKTSVKGFILKVITIINQTRSSENESFCSFTISQDEVNPRLVSRCQLKIQPNSE